MLSTKEQIVQYITNHGPTTVKQLVEHFGLYATIIHRHLKDLVEEKQLNKVGQAPKVYYIRAQTEQTLTNEFLTHKQLQFLQNNYFNYDSDGKLMQGYEGFIYWCQERKLDIKHQFVLYQSIIESIENQKDNLGLIDGKHTLSSRLGKIYLSDLKFVDAYQIGHFGRSKLGSMTFYAKQSQNKDLIRQAVDIIKIPIIKYIHKYKIDAICFTPPSITRPVQFMYEIKKQLKLDLPEIKLIKLFPSGVIIPQKSLKSMDQRVKNATNTLFVSPGQSPAKHVLIIDDFMGSGATINLSAKKILDANLAEKISAITLLGNIDTKYEVINEV